MRPWGSVVNSMRLSQLLAGATLGVLLLSVAAVPARGQQIDHLSANQWTYLGLAGPNLRDLQLHGERLYGASDSGLFVRNAAAADTVWTRIGFEGDVVWAFDVVSSDTLVAVVLEGNGEPGQHQRLFRSIDGGETWHRIAENLEEDAPEERFGFIRHLPGSVEVLFAGGHGSLTKSEDGGETWRAVFGGWDASGMGVHFIAFDPAHPETMWSGGESTIFWPFLLESTDGGDNWDEVSIFLGGDNAIYSMEIDPGGRLYIGAEGSVLKSDDGGATWETILAPDTYEYFFGIGISKTNPSRLYAAGMRNALDQKLTLYISDNAGESWTTAVHGEESTWLGVEHFAMQSGAGFDTLYLGTRYDGVYAFTTAVPSGTGEGGPPPLRPVLHQNAPNPFAHSTRISFSTVAAAPVRLTIYDAVGREIATLIDAVLPPGLHEIEWWPNTIQNGILFCRMEVGDFSSTRPMIILK